MGCRKELNAQDVEKVVGGNYQFDYNTGEILIGVSGNFRTFKVKPGVKNEYVDSLMIGAYKESYTNDENDAAMIKAIKDYVIEVPNA